MRILILVHGYPPTATGGAELRAARTARTLVSRGHDVRVLAIEPGDAPVGHARQLEEDHDGVIVCRLFLEQPEPRRPLSWEYDDPQTARALGKMIDAWRPDLVHLFSGYRMTGSVIRETRARGLPIVVSLTDFWWLCHRITLLRTDGCRCEGPTPNGCARCHSEMQRRFRLPARVWRQPSDAFWRLSDHSSALSSRLNAPHFAERLQSGVDALNQADTLIAPSQYLADVYAEHGVDSAKIRTWRQGVDMDRCLPRSESAALRVAYLGQVKYHKGVDLLLDAWGMLRDSVPRNLVLYGSHEGEAKYGKRIRRQVTGLDGATWAEPFPREEIWSVLSNLDVIVVPSRWVENSPNVILEAQAVGVVVVGTDLGGVAELVRHEVNGLLFEPDNAADLAIQLQRLLDEPALLARLRGAPAPFQSHIAEVEQIESLYDSLVPSIPDLSITTSAAG